MMDKAKTIALISLIFLTAVLSVTGVIPIAHAEAVEQTSLRELLISSENTEEVFAIDDYHTFVRPNLVLLGIRSGKPSEDFSKEVVAACNTQMEVNTRRIDPITRRTIETWIPYDGESYIFNELVRNGIRCKGEFEIITTYGSNYRVRSFIIKHEKPQPFVFKTEHISADKITTPADGELKLVKPMDVGGFLRLMVGGAGEVVYEELVVFQYATALCRNNNGRMRFVINRGKFVPDPRGRWIKVETGERGRYVDEYAETSALEAFDYAKTAPSVKDSVHKTSFYACEGDNRFIVRSDASRFYFASQKGLEGIKYMPLPHAKKPKIPQIVGPQLPTSIEEQVAMEAASKGINIFRVSGAQGYTGIYNGKDQNRCDLVTVKKNWNIGAVEPRIDIYNYKICNGVIVKASETGIEVLPQNIEVFIQNVARAAQKLGSVSGDYQGWTVKAQALRDKDQCLVGIKVLKGINLIAEKTVNGCQ